MSQAETVFYCFQDLVVVSQDQKRFIIYAANHKKNLRFLFDILGETISSDKLVSLTLDIDSENLFCQFFYLTTRKKIIFLSSLYSFIPL
jgi:hypothetical protein